MPFSAVVLTSKSLAAEQFSMPDGCNITNNGYWVCHMSSAIQLALSQMR